MTSRIIVSFLIINVLLAFSGHAQVIRSFENRASFNVNGNITMTGNTLMTCGSSVSNCQGIQNGQVSASNYIDMVYVNVDPAAGYNNSSSATLTLPVGASVLHAELYWSARHNGNDANRNRIRIKAPGSGSYVRVTAHTIDTYGSEGESGSRPYQASADITQMVQSAGSGQYTVADLRAKTGEDGLGFYGGWAIAVVYQDNSQPFRRLMLFDGAARVVGNNTVSITTDNLVTPYSGPFDTYLGALVWEGDFSISGDAFVFQGNTLSDSLNPANNYWNSSITAFNSRVTNKNPDYVNQLAMDLVMTDVSGLLANGETQANIDFVTSGDSYFPHALAFVTDLYLPDFASSMTKTATDMNGGQVEPGDMIEYRIAFENTGQDVAINTIVTDSLPAGITYVPNSLEIVTSSAGPAGTMTDSSGDDAGEYDSNSNTITFWVGNNAGPNQGGDFLPGESAVVKFWATVDEQNSGTVTNTAFINFNAQSNPTDPLSANNDAAINVMSSADISVTKTAQLSVDNGNPGTADAGDEITFVIDVDNNGNLSMSNIALSDAMAPLGVNCPQTTLPAYSSMQCDSYSYTVTQTDMNNGGTIDNTVNLTALDATGGNHQSSDSTQTTITLLAPVISSPNDGDLLNNNTPTITGIGPVGAQIDVLTDQGSSCQAIVTAQGDWSCDLSPALSDGTVIISAFASDGGNNQSATDSITINLDAQAPGAPGVDAPTNGQPISGTGEPGATVTVTTESGGSCTAVVQANGTWSCILAGPFADGDDITVTQEDAAGNVSPPTVIPNGIDTQAPTVTISAPVAGALTNDNTPTVSGTSEAGAAISVTIAGIEVCSTVTDGSGNWSCDVSPALSDGSVQIDVTATDAANNTSNPESVTITVDATPPNAPLINSPSNGQPVSGSGGEPGATVNVTTPGGASCSALVQPDGSWSCTLTGNLLNNDDIIATQTDPAGNTSAPTTVPGGLDTQAPTVTISAPVAGALTNDNTPTVSGTSEAGAAISVTIAGIEVCSTVTDGSGNWSCDVSPALSDGSVQIDVTATDAANNTSNPESVTITVDATPPNAPLINSPSNGQPVSGSGGEPGATVNVTTPGGASCNALVQADGSWSCTLTGNLLNNDDIIATQTDPAGNTSAPTTVPGGLDTQAPTVTISAPVAGALTNDNTPTVSGTSEAGAAISVTIAGIEVCSTVADGSGNWSCDVSPALSDGSVQIDVTATDAANNTSNPESVTITVDATPPNAPVINIPTNGAPVTGTGEPGATVTVTTDSSGTCTALVQADGSWSCTLSGPITDGDNIYATQDDPAGNTSPQTTENGGIDTVPPAAPVVTSPVDGTLTNNNTALLVGTAEPGATVIVTGPQGETCSVVADVNGDWSCTIAPALGDGANLLSVIATDAANNTSAATELTLNVDTESPLAPVINVPTNGAPVTGTGEPGATVTVTTDSSGTCTALVQADGSWSCTLSGPITDGDNIYATQDDPAGNTSPQTTENGGIDTVPPAAPVVTSPVDGTLTNNNTALLVGTAEPGATVIVTGPQGETCSVVADVNGDWSCTIAPALGDGANLLSVIATDAANNTSAATELTLNVDTESPLAPVINVPTNGAPVTGTGEPGATVTVTTDSSGTCTALVQADGSWSCTLSGPITDGDNIYATQDDPAGNTSPQTTENGGIDTEAPGAPSIDTPVNGTTINNPSPVIGGTAEANSIVTVSNQSGPVCVAQTNASGQWSCTPDSPLADGLQQLQAVATDAAGNDSVPGTSSFQINSAASYTLVFTGIDDLKTTEAGATDNFTIALPLTPTADVTVNISSSDTTEGTVSPGSVTFTTANWNTPVMITVTGVDDQVYDQDQAYTIDFSPLNSADNNYNGVQVSSVNVSNEDDDAQPDLSVFITNCIDGSLPQQSITYYLTVSNEGNKAIQGARLNTQFPVNISTPDWECNNDEGQACIPATGQGDLDELIDLDVNESMLFTMNGQVSGQLNDFIDVYATIEMPSGETDINPLNNQAEDHDLLYQFLFKDGFECAAPGTVETTNQQLLQLYNLQ